MGSGLKDKATKLRKQGWSYNIIADRLGVNKSTLSGWLKDAPYQPNATVLRRIKTGPRKSGERRRAQRIAKITEANLLASNEIGNLSARDLFILGIGLYIGEGIKSFEQTRFVNSDPNVIRAVMCWFRNVCLVPNHHFRITLHIYPDNHELKAKKYWSKITGIPKHQFYKTFVDVRATKKINKGKLPFGTAHITVYACGKKEFGVALHRKISGWINAVYERTNAGVV